MARKLSLPPKTVCSGCGACVASCPAGALFLSPDSEGFLYPSLDATKCISCEKCSRVCPVLHPPVSVPPVSCFAARSVNPDIRRQSSSGGVFAVMARKIISEGGVVYGATMLFPECTVRHICIQSVESLPSIQGSKYVQGNASDRFSEIRDVLRTGRTVLFSGLPCQIAALSSFLRDKPPNLVLLSVVCHGVPSQDVFLQYRDEVVSSVDGKRVRGFVFRDKRRGWKQYFSTWLIDTNAGEVRIEDDFFVKTFTRDLYSRPSCHRCVFRNFSSDSDITLGDYWGGKQFPSEWNDDSGISLVLLHSDKGRKLFNALSPTELMARKTPLDDALPENPSLILSSTPRRYRWLFFLVRKKLSFRNSVKLALGIEWLLSLPGHLRPSELKKRFERLLK